MRRRNFSALVSLVLLGSVALTTVFGLVQANLDLHQFQFHKYSAYCTLALMAIHVALNGSNILKWAREKGPHRRRDKRGRELHQRGPVQGSPVAEDKDRSTVP